MKKSAKSVTCGSHVTDKMGRTPRATNISQFYDGANGSRHPGDWPSLLRRSWEGRFGQVQPYPYGPDNMQSRGSRASQYSS